MIERLKLKSSVIIIPIMDNKILLFERKNTGWEDGKFTVPSGHIEEGETPVEAAIREVKEELGIVVKVEDLKFVHVDFIKDQMIDFAFEITKWSGEPRLMEEELSANLKWYDLDALPDNIAGHGLQILNNIKKGIYYLELGNE